MAEWFESIPVELTIDQDGTQVPLRDQPFIKESKDLPSFVKQAYDTHREVGSRIPVKIDSKNAAQVEQWRKEHLPKLYEAGVLIAPPASADEYEVKPPEKLPEGMAWNDELVKEFKSILHKHGMPKAAVADLIALQTKAMMGVQETFKVDHDTGIAALKREFGADFDKRMEMANRLIPHIFKTPEDTDMVERLGLGNHPPFLGILMRLSHFAEQDSSFTKDVNRGGGGSGMKPEEIRAELGRIQTDKNHPDYAGYWRKDPAVMAKIDKMYTDGYGSKIVNISEGIHVEPAPKA